MSFKCRDCGDSVYLFRRDSDRLVWQHRHKSDCEQPRPDYPERLAEDEISYPPYPDFPMEEDYDEAT